MAAPSFEDRDGLIWVDGAMVAWRDAKVHLLTHALHYAGAVFEGQRAYGGRIFKLREHTERLLASARTLGYEIPHDADAIDAAAYEVMLANGLSDCYIRPIAWRGSEQMGVAAQANRIHLGIAAWQWPAYFSMEARLKGLRLDMAQWRRPDPATAPSNAKVSGLYMICTMSKHTAENKGYHDALMLDWRGRVAEATGANIFFVKGNEVHTPTPDCFLDGITRRTVAGLAKKRGFQVIERAIEPAELEGFEQCFLTGTAAEVSPVSEIGPYRFAVGDACATLMQDYDDLVRGR